ncbi:SAM-dependent methyltransferase [Peribacillus deserti]|uniref:SAM-dependent methyltransferase n=1 Tax=Peribacillus deserti TaxID=673318 RepID=A0ABS2QHZ2_9BACI|nr:class I SAM-dependent methyltransferase [Peribacillus deserti]MBM7692762.1 SAM-dependent methyltransferase [Peribacillus deserti]
MKEYYYDKLLNIKTAGDQQGFHKSLHYHRYEPTPYSALEVLFSHYELNSHDRVVDFGCGKGRLNFYIHHLFNSSAIGIEMDEGFYEDAVKNRNTYFKGNMIRNNIQFRCCLAEDYSIDPSDNRFYFFNPFSGKVFIKVVNHILQSVEEFNRQVELILYYPPLDYIYYLENDTDFQLIKEIELPEYARNMNERFLIYRLG